MQAAAASGELPLLETSLEVGLSGPSRLHDLFVTHEAMSPGEWKAKGGGLDHALRLPPTPFGLALVMVTDRGLAGLAFADDEGGRDACFEDMAKRWPNAHYVEDRNVTAPYIRRIFDSGCWAVDEPLRVVLIGSDFQIRVWQSLLKFLSARPSPIRTSPATLASQPQAVQWELPSGATPYPLSFPASSLGKKPAH